MAKKKEDAGKVQASRRQVAGKSQETCREVAGKSQASRRKKQEDIEKAKEAVQEFLQDVKPFELCVVFAEGDNIDMVAKQLTGHSYMAFKVCEYSGVKYQDVRPGTILKWPVR